jgi:hypothetical protein
VWWYTAVIPALQRLRHEDHEFKAGLGSMARSWLRKEINEKEIIF